MVERTRLEPGTRATAAPNVRTRAFDDELVVLDLDAGEYYSLDAIGARLWEGLQRGLSISEIASAVAKEYDAPADRVLADLVSLAEELVRRHLITAGRNDR